MMQVNPYESPRLLSTDAGARTLQDGRWSLALTGFFAGGYVGAWFGSLSGAGVGVTFAAVAGTETVGYRDPALSFIETLVTTGLLLAIIGTFTGGALGATLGAVLGAFVAVFEGGLRNGFVGVSCVLACVAAVSLTAAMLGLDATVPEWRSSAMSQQELVARVAALGVVGFGGLMGGGLLGRILREVAWETGASRDVAADALEPRMVEGTGGDKEGTEMRRSEVKR